MEVWPFVVEVIVAYPLDLVVVDAMVVVVVALEAVEAVVKAVVKAVVEAVVDLS